MAYAKRFADEQPSHDESEFLAALRGGDLDRSDRLLVSLPENLPDNLLRGVAELHMLRERWSKAEAALAKLHKPDGEAVMRRRLSSNLAAMQQHRPEIYKAIADAEQNDRFELIASKSGPMTIAYRHVGSNRKTILSGDGDPLGSVAKVMATLKEANAAGKALGLAGIGDGYLLAALARSSPKLFLGREQSISLYEPDARLVLACLMIHDYAGPSGPIEQRRFNWFVGHDWSRQLRQKCFADLMIPYPQITLRLGMDSDEIQKELQSFLVDIAQLDGRARLQVQSYYQHLSREELVGVSGPKPYRKPRVMMITTRFSTVLQYSARDTADAFEMLGWESQLIIEPSPAHGINRIAIRQALARFRPDLVFQIDHLRREWGDLFPSNLPFVCWVQDHLPNLTSAEAGKSVRGREFVLIPSVQRYVSNFGYPPTNCMEFRKLTRVPKRPAMWTSDGDDMVYVSNWSQTPQAMATQVVQELKSVAQADLVKACCDRMIQIYESGANLATPGDVRRVVESIQGKPLEPQSQLTLITTLFERFNNVLYRQQGLRWAAQIAELRGRTLAIYGNGWAENPEFARYAKGYTKYGEALEDLSRRSKVNLVLEPYVCVTHQRLLDCLVAGGFVLSRAHPQMTVVQGLIDLFASGNVSGPLFEKILRQSRDADATPGEFDPIKTLRALQAAGFMPESGPMLPRIAETTFDSMDELGACVDRYLADADRRRLVANEQRKVVEDRYSYAAGMKRMIERIRERIAAEEATLRAAA